MPGKNNKGKNLPAGWSSSISEKSHPGQPYYKHTNGRSQWTSPAILERIPEGWSEKVDDKRKKVYYFNKSTGKKQWNVPTANSSLTDEKVIAAEKEAKRLEQARKVAEVERKRLEQLATTIISEPRQSTGLSVAETVKRPNLKIRIPATTGGTRRKLKKKCSRRTAKCRN